MTNVKIVSSSAKFCHQNSCLVGEKEHKVVVVVAVTAAVVSDAVYQIGLYFSLFQLYLSNFFSFFFDKTRFSLPPTQLASTITAATY